MVANVLLLQKLGCEKSLDFYRRNLARRPVPLTLKENSQLWQQYGVDINALKRPYDSRENVANSPGPSLDGLALTSLGPDSLSCEEQNSKADSVDRANAGTISSLQKRRCIFVDAGFLSRYHLPQSLAATGKFRHEAIGHYVFGEGPQPPSDQFARIQPEVPPLPDPERLPPLPPTPDPEETRAPVGGHSSRSGKRSREIASASIAPKRSRSKTGKGRQAVGKINWHSSKVSKRRCCALLMNRWRSIDLRRRHSP
jgi:hypothetical protein